MILEIILPSIMSEFIASISESSAKNFFSVTGGQGRSFFILIEILSYLTVIIVNIIITGHFMHSQEQIHKTDRSPDINPGSETAGRDINLLEMPSFEKDLQQNQKVFKFKLIGFEGNFN